MIEIKVDKSIVSVQNKPLLYCGAQDVHICRFTFDGSWEKFIKSAVFRVDGRATTVLVDENGCCRLPWELLTRGNVGHAIEVGVYGVSAETEVLTSVWDSLGTVRDGAEPGKDAQEPSAGVYQQVMSGIQSLNSKVNKYYTAVNTLTQRAESAAALCKADMESADQRATDADTAMREAQSALKSIQNALDRLPKGDTLVINDLSTGGAGAALSAEMGKTLAQRQGRNLLDNSNFQDPVNQRGLTSYSGDRGYCIDRWQRNKNLTVDVTAAGITITNAVAEACGFSQIVPGGIAPTAGETVTIAFEDATGTVYARTVTVPESGTKYAYINESVSVGVVVPSAANLAGAVTAAVLIKNSQTVTMRWIAMYRGAYTGDALPPYQPKGYGAELRECQRYYQQPKTTGSVRAGTILNGVMTFSIPVAVTMREGVVISGMPQVREITGQSEVADFVFSIVGQSPGYITVQAAKSAHGMADAILRPSGMAFVADL